MKRLRVTSKQFRYDVVVGRGAWGALRKFPCDRYTSAFVITEETLWERWKGAFLKESGLVARPLFVPPGEMSKSLRMLERLATELSENGADRHTLLVMFGGGVVGDLGGFLASTYMRGIDYVQVPTTVVAQVDSAVGGKTGVDVGLAKNLIGTFYPPRLVLADPTVLSSLSERAFRSGLYEVVKHGVLKGPLLFDKLETDLDALHPENAETLGPILAKAVQVKVDVVGRDEREAGLRAVLNLGHTLGHALEEATRYRRFLHGEAVGWGLLAATRLAKDLGVLASSSEPKSDESRIVQLVKRVGPLPPIRDLDPGRILELLPRDKKTVGGKLHWVLPERIGKMRIVSDVPKAAVATALRSVQQSSAEYEG